jgi:hypothetical protein
MLRYKGGQDSSGHGVYPQRGKRRFHHWRVHHRCFHHRGIHHRGGFIIGGFIIGGFIIVLNKEHKTA